MRVNTSAARVTLALFLCLAASACSPASRSGLRGTTGPTPVVLKVAAESSRTAGVAPVRRGWILEGVVTPRYASDGHGIYYISEWLKEPGNDDWREENVVFAERIDGPPRFLRIDDSRAAKELRVHAGLDTSVSPDGVEGDGVEVLRGPREVQLIDTSDGSRTIVFRASGTDGPPSLGRILARGRFVLFDVGTDSLSLESTLYVYNRSERTLTKVGPVVSGDWDYDASSGRMVAVVDESAMLFEWTLARD